MKISLLVPLYNEEKSLEAAINSCLNQTRPFDELIFVDDCSKDASPEILKKFGDQIQSYRTPKNTGNKSSAQEFGLQFVTGDVMVTTDADTLLDPHFVEEIEKSFKEEKTFAVAGYVKSLPHNWLTLCRAFYYVVGQDLHKVAQGYMNYIFVMPGAASAFNVEAFRKHITFDHDTITEDLDFTYKMHSQNLKIVYNRQAISYTQDPATLYGYINQMRRWYNGGWQNLKKHYRIINNPVRAMELSLIYIEGLVFSLLLFIIPILNLWLGVWMIAMSFVVTVLYSAWAAWKIKRPALLFSPIPYTLLIFINAYLFLETFTKEIILNKHNLVWFKPERTNISPF